MGGGTSRSRVRVRDGQLASDKPLWGIAAFFLFGVCMPFGCLSSFLPYTSIFREIIRIYIRGRKKTWGVLRQGFVAGRLLALHRLWYQLRAAPIMEGGMVA